MAIDRSYYDILQVAPTAESDVLAAAYRTLALRRHPDHGGSTAAMAELNEAWHVLRDPRRRAAYDQARAAASGTPSMRTYSAVRAAGADAPAHPFVPAEGPLASRRPRPTSRTVLDFGRYSGWTLDAIARHDPGFLEWLRRTPVGRRYQAEIDTLLTSRSAA